MSFAFSRSGSKLGYVPSQVDAFLASARQQYLDPQSQTMDAASVRSARFELVKDGYSISAVDTAMENLKISSLNVNSSESITQLDIKTLFDYWMKA